jgi:signal peptidase I
MKPIRIFRDVALALTAVSLAIAAGLSIYFQLSFLTITSRSMEPTISAGDMVLTRPIHAAEIRSRDIVVLPVPDAQGLRYSHRVIGVKKDSLWEKIGLSSGDVITGVNGISMSQPDQGFALYQALQDDREIRVELLKQGNAPTTINVEIKN